MCMYACSACIFLPVYKLNRLFRVQSSGFNSNENLSIGFTHKMEFPGLQVRYMRTVLSTNAVCRKQYLE